jgi:predicted amidohydrolase YtcJ
MKFIFILSVFTLYSFANVHSQMRADIIIVNAKIFFSGYSDTTHDAIAIIKNKIHQTGKQSAILAFKGKKTLVIDARGRRLIPGLFDSHLHFIRGGRFYNTELRWDGVPTLQRALEMLKEQAARTPKGQWVRIVGGWNEWQFAEKRLPTLEELNEAAGEVPVFILYLYGKAWLNKAGLKSLGITGTTPNPPGGVIQKDQEGVPTGLLVAEPNAFVLYSTLAKLPELSLNERINSTLQYMTELNRLGVTAAMDAGGGFQNYPEDYLVTDSLSRAGKITLRLPYFLFAQRKGAELGDYGKWINMTTLDLHEQHGTNKIEYHIQGAGENLIAEAADFENFLYPRPELSPGMDLQLRAVISLLVKNRWPFRLHATYDESISRFLGVMESVNAETPFNGLIWFIDHAETISDKNIQRIKALGGGIAIQHRMAYQGEAFIQRYGKAAATNAPPVINMLAAGLPVGLGTDGTRVASYNPWAALKWITTGQSVGGLQVMSKENTLTRTQALALLTKGSYALIKEENTKGSIAKGFIADLVLLNKDYFTISDDELTTVSSLLTIVDGKIVYADGDYKALAPPVIPVVPLWSPVKFYGGIQQ